MKFKEAVKDAWVRYLDVFNMMIENGDTVRSLKIIKQRLRDILIALFVLIGDLSFWMVLIFSFILLPIAIIIRMVKK